MGGGTKSAEEEGRWTKERGKTLPLKIRIRRGATQGNRIYMWGNWGACGGRKGGE